MTKYYICQVCGFDRLSEQAFEGGKIISSYEICPCCGFENGYHDTNANSKYPDDWDGREIAIAYRKEWIANGMKWKHEDSDSLELKPKDWNPREQLRNIPKEFLASGENYN